MKYINVLILVLVLIMTSCGKKEETTTENNNIKKDEKSVYYKDQKVKDANPESFENLNKYYGKDNENIYALDTTGNEMEKIEVEDIKTFEIIKWTYAKDKNNTYSLQKKVNLIKGLEVLNDFYAKAENKAYFMTKEVTEADISSFTPLNEYYAKDKNNIYFGSAKLPKAIDNKTFTAIKGVYAKTNWWVYRIWQKIKWMDPASVEILEKQWVQTVYLKDKNGIYRDSAEYWNPSKFSLAKMEKVDPKSFEIIDNKYSKDKSNCYKETKIVEMSECEKLSKEEKTDSSK